MAMTDMTIWTFPEHPWPEEKSIRWSGEPGCGNLVCMIPGGRTRRVIWEDGCPVFSLYDCATGSTFSIEGWEVDEELLP